MVFQFFYMFENFSNKTLGENNKYALKSISFVVVGVFKCKAIGS